MNITIVGAGNIGTQFAVHCAAKGHRVIMYSSKPQKISKALSIVDKSGMMLKEGNIYNATDDIKEAIEDAELIFVTLPPFMMSKLAEDMLEYVKPGTKIALIPGTGGGECAFKKCLEKECVIFGLQRVPSVARLVEYGKSVCAVGYRNELHVAALPKRYTSECCELMKSIFDIMCTELPCYLNLTLTPSNPILHTTRLRTIFKDYEEGKLYESVPLFYEEWSDETSELLIECDKEVQTLCKALKQYDLSNVKSLLVHYESENAKQLTSKIRSIPGFKGLSTPSIMKGDKYAPDLNSRYFTADFSYGLSILVQIADFVGVSVQNMLETLKWYQKIAIVDDTFSYIKYGIDNIDKFNEFYSK